VKSGDYLETEMSQDDEKHGDGAQSIKRRYVRAAELGFQL
jgi:hypothetical protein